METNQLVIIVTVSLEDNIICYTHAIIYGMIHNYMTRWLLIPGIAKVPGS